MSTISWTEAQRRGIETVDRSVLVSAAAGSGKTAVLAERCAYLVCDAPPPFRCDVDQLLVLTFTEAAAAEMRERIVKAIRQRSLDRPGDPRLREQLVLVDAAQISTIHAFCLWLVRRGFSELGVDPGAVLLDAEEAALLRSEVLEELFSDLYGSVSREDDVLGAGRRADAQEQPQYSPAAFAERFARLVDDYGLGRDGAIKRFVLRLRDFAGSLPEPDAWLDGAMAGVGERAEWTAAELFARMWRELELQLESCRQIALELRAMPAVCAAYAQGVENYVARLEDWSVRLRKAFVAAGVGPSNEIGALWSLSREAVVALLGEVEAVRGEIAEDPFDIPTGPRLSRDTDPNLKELRDRASKRCRDVVRDRLFRKRLRDGFALSSAREQLDGLRKTEPYVSTLVELVRRFDRAYEERKRRLDALDFADLERLAYRLLGEDGEEGSAVARMMRNRFAHVLVDEYQDINPIQEAILRCVSREMELDRPANLFSVGDVKQSIYRFRLAEPALFLARQAAFGESAAARGGVIPLQKNFRSRPEILEAVNLVFERLMRTSTCGIAYDDAARLHVGRTFDANESPLPVELHLLERRFDSGSADDNGDGAETVEDVGQWSAMEREAYLIGTRIHALRSEAARSGGTPPEYRDIAILLRAARVNAEQMAGVLARMGIPAFADVGGSLFDALEIRDVLAALEVLDNPQQDIPLAAVMRGGVLGVAFDEDELVAIRCVDRSRPFHACVAAYAEGGADESLRRRVDSLLRTIVLLREKARRRPLAEIVWHLYEAYGHLTRCGAMSNGMQRRANLLKLHDLARRFGTFRRQGLHRFLRFVEALREEGSEVAAAPALGAAEDVVRIISIHQSKGLEFPIVFVAGTGTKFNLQDRSGAMIFERRAHVGLKVLDTQRMLAYPSAAHRLAAGEIEQAAREEEMRVLYVAMTRAEERLFLVGSVVDAKRKAEAIGTAADAESPPNDLDVVTAQTPLDWIIPALASAPRRLVGDGSNEESGGSGDSIVTVRGYGDEEMSSWTTVPAAGDSNAAMREAVAHGRPLPPDEPVRFDDPEVAQTLERIDWVYPTLSSAVTRAALAASEVKGELDFTRPLDQRLAEVVRPGDSADWTFESGAARREEAAARGIAHHRFLQHVRFRDAGEEGGLASELHRLKAAGLLREEESGLLDEDALRWFLSGELAQRIARAGDDYRRELAFIALEPAGLFEAAAEAPAEDRVLVRGVVDGVLVESGAVEIVDFKTDAVEGAKVEERALRYRPQMALYARAMERLFRRPVRAAWLVFLHPRRIICLDNPAEAAVDSLIIQDP
ncbi:MAG: UvrD-helicase domain-containing protein [Phycisphaerae bacterium]|nr:UvrD-helicase domain-containing protein [Phycisphaerae bacterium]